MLSIAQASLKTCCLSLYYKDAVESCFIPGNRSNFPETLLPVTSQKPRNQRGYVGSSGKAQSMFCWLGDSKTRAISWRSWQILV